MMKFDKGIRRPPTTEEILRAMKPDESHVVDDEPTRRRFLTVAKRKGIKVESWKLEDGNGFRIWRTK